jgi:hypothetical protein
MPRTRCLKRLAASVGALALASCAATNVVPPPVPERAGRSALSVDSGASDAPASAPTPVPKVTTGRVEFRGFTHEALEDFRVIPEEGTVLFIPTNGTHSDVDGFWWRPSRQWFKIPNHCSVIITAAPTPDQPSAFTEIHDCGRLGSALQKFRGLPDTAGFYLDVGATGHGTDYPFPP